MSETKKGLAFTLVLLTSLALIAFSTSGPKAGQDTQRAAEKVINAAAGGEISVFTVEGAEIVVIFPQQSLVKDTTIVMTPLSAAPLPDADLVVKGFQIEEKGKAGQGPKLISPAVIRISLKIPVSENVSIIKYAGDGKNYDVIPTAIEVEGQSTILTAEVAEFSKYGVKTVTKKQIKDAADEQKNSMTQRGFIWVIEFKDSLKTKAPDGTNVTMTLDMTVVNRSGARAGHYTGAATLISVGVKNVGAPVPGAAIATLKGSRVDFGTYWNIRPAPLAKPKPGSLPPSTPLVKVELRAKGTMKFAMSMESPLTPEIDVETVDIPFELFTTGSQAVITFKIPGTQQLTFNNGTVTRKGKK